LRRTGSARDELMRTEHGVTVTGALTKYVSSRPVQPAARSGNRVNPPARLSAPCNA
jgi:hypothetical protein